MVLVIHNLSMWKKFTNNSKIRSLITSYDIYGSCKVLSIKGKRDKKWV